MAFNTVVNVTDYGAVGDNATDDSGAFTSAAAALTSGGIIWVPDGSYKIGANVTLGTTIKMVGESSDAKIYIDPGVNFDVYYIQYGLTRLFWSTGNSIVRGGSNVEWWGATGDGSTDDTNTINRAMQGVQGWVTFQSGSTYKCQGVDILSGVYVDLNGATISAVDDSSGYVLRFSEATDCELKGGTVQGAGGSGNARINVSIKGGTNIRLRNVASDDGQDGYYIGAADDGDPAYSTRVLMRNCTSDGAARNGMSVVSCTASEFRECTFTGAQGSNPGAGIDVEPDNSNDSISDLLFAGCTTSDTNTTYGMLVTYGGTFASAMDLTIKNCTLDSASKGLEVRNLPAGSVVTIDQQTKVSY